MAAISVSGVDFVTVPANDIEASKRFYGSCSACRSSSSGARCRRPSTRQAT